MAIKLMKLQLAWSGHSGAHWNGRAGNIENTL
jgi:hypothetical protein